MKPTAFILSTPGPGESASTLARAHFAREDRQTALKIALLVMGFLVLAVGLATVSAIVGGAIG